MFLFRADGNSTVGIGHVMRCLSIADALVENREKIAFICADENMKQTITERGYECYVLGTYYGDMESELERLTGSRLYQKAKTIIVDSYFVTNKYIDSLSEEKNIVYIDDFYSNYSVSGIINYNVFADKSRYDCIYSSKSPKLFIGPQYAPLRRDFYDSKAIEIKNRVTDILVLTGGADPLHMALGFVEKLLSKKESFVTYHLVVGAMSPDLDALRNIEKENSFIKIHYNVKDMKSLMQRCDIAISAAGSTLYELCACGVPTINYVLADNQKLISESFTKKEIMVYAGDMRTETDYYENLLRHIKELSCNPNKRCKLSTAAHDLVDGKGAIRLAGKLREYF